MLSGDIFNGSEVYNCRLFVSSDDMVLDNEQPGPVSHPSNVTRLL